MPKNEKDISVQMQETDSDFAIYNHYYGISTGCVMKAKRQ